MRFTVESLINVLRLGSIMSSTEEKFTLIWKIENVSFTTTTFTQPILSPCFSLNSMDKTSWFLKFSAKSLKSKGFVSVRLSRDDKDSGPEKISIGFKGYIVAIDGSSRFTKEVDSIIIEKDHEIRLIREIRDEFFKSRILSSKDSLSICCELWKNCSNNDTTKPSTVIAAKSLDVSCGEVPRNIYEEVSKDLKGISKLQDLNPIKFHAKTQIQLEKKTFIHHINDFSSLQSPFNFSFVMHSTSNGIPPLLLTMSFIDDLSTVKIYISPLSEKVDRSFVLKCKAFILANKGSPLSVMNETHFFESAEEPFWKTTFNNYEFLAERVLYFPDDVLSVRFELDISVGTEISSIEKIIYANPKKIIKKERTLMEDLLNYYKEQKFCDVKLCANNEQVLAHKAVLCSRSTFFRKLFKTEMTSKPPEVIEINNIDIYTLKLMLEFMYIEKIDDFQFEDVLKLYSAGVFYEYEKLKRLCCSFLSSNIQTDNVCEILKLSHFHDDEELKASAINHIRLHAKEVFLMDEWKQLILDNVMLASEIVGYLSSVIQGSGNDSFKD
ncbi:speckle-type POZ protein [Caerostris extrusa]|uniref:Speckle-type POZ protein n=1 Tax=Caerostris extrusa TaxID=172846 RepID=A0AAV4RCB2_CAEEX|nr:speckle-type POZ protein [Caerostris extrusa]